MSVANLIVPAIRWDREHGYDAARPEIERGLAIGVGGFVLYGGDADAVRLLTKELRQRSKVPLLIAADLERGAGQQFDGATALPPLAAIASLGDPDAVRRAARLTAREARTLGVNWDFAPVCDVDLAPDNPITGTRTFGSDPHRVASLAEVWIKACQGEGVLACAKHFPGHGRTTADSHTELPVVDASRRELEGADLLPFRAAINAGVASMMTAHVAYPSLDPSGLPATLSREIVQWLLRQQLRFDGLVVSDSLVMEGVRAGRGEDAAAVGALAAGCDVLLQPSDMVALAHGLERALSNGALPAENVRHALRRRLKWAQWASPPNEYRRPSATDVAWGAQLAVRVVRMVRGAQPALTPPIEVVVIGDGDDATARGRHFVAALRDAGVGLRTAAAPSGEPGWSTVIALFGEPRVGQGAGYGAPTRDAVARACASAPDALLLQFAHPRLIRDLPWPRAIATAWSGDRVMQEGAGRWVGLRASSREP